MSRSTPGKSDVLASFTTFGDLLRYLRQHRQLTQRDLALATGYSISQISRLEHNERLPDELTLLAVFVPALGLEEEPATVEHFLLLARRANGEDKVSTMPPAPSPAPAFPDHAAPLARPKLTNLPQRLSSFIGRDQEVAALQQWVQAHRLVTLTGVGGVGKSSLALALGQTILDWGLGIREGETAAPPNAQNLHSKTSNPGRHNLNFPDGVWLLELAPISEGELVARLLADLFQLPESPGGTPQEAVIAYLQHKALLLIVDNCEHLISTCAELVERLLHTSATLHIVATSREALNVAGEREWPVLPLATPMRVATSGAMQPLQQLKTFASTQLFIERAQAVKADLIFTDEAAPLIIQLCQQLDGLPLALELAAARCKSFTLPEIVVRLQDRFALLSAGRRTALLRHQTLRATLDWSYDLLSPTEAALFRRLSVFVGGWTISAAEAVADEGQGRLATFDLLHQLVNKSLVVVDQQGENSRYRMLETLREYASEKLQGHGESETVRARHFGYYLALAEKASPANLLGARLDQWFNAVKADLDNVRVAFAWSQSQADRGEKSLRLATALGPFWQLLKNFSEGGLWLEHALARADPANAELTSWGIVWLAFTLFYASPRSFALATEAHQRFTVLNQPDGLALANLLLGIWAVARGEAATAIACLQQACVQFEQKQAVYLLGRAYFYLADAFGLTGKREQALDYYRRAFQLGKSGDGYSAFQWVWRSMALIDPGEALALCQNQLIRQRQRQNQTKVAGLLRMLGHICTAAGDLPGALAALTESLALWEKLGIDWHRGGGAGRVCLDLALVQYLCQEHQAAMVYAQKAIHLFQEAGDLHRVAYAYVALGYPALAVNDLSLASASFQRCIQIITAQEINCTYLALVGLAEIARCQAKPALAARLFGATERFAQRPKPIEDRGKEVYCQPLLAAAHIHLRETAYAAAWSEGETMPFAEALQLALTIA